MLTLQNNAHRWILATIVKSGNRQFWGWPRLFFVMFFLLLFFLAYVEPKLIFSLSRGKILQCSPYHPPEAQVSNVTTQDPHQICLQCGKKIIVNITSCKSMIVVHSRPLSKASDLKFTLVILAVK
jgi:hypothetical protein